MSERSDLLRKMQVLSKSLNEREGIEESEIERRIEEGDKVITSLAIDVKVFGTTPHSLHFGKHVGFLEGGRHSGELNTAQVGAVSNAVRMLEAAGKESR